MINEVYLSLIYNYVLTVYRKQVCMHVYLIDNQIQSFCIKAQMQGFKQEDSWKGKQPQQRQVIQEESNYYSKLNCSKPNTFPANSKKGLVGLKNLGNTSFMISCIQCLSNTQRLTNYFLSSFYKKEINTVNPLGTKGQLAQCYAQLLKGLWLGAEDTLSPIHLKSLIAKNAPMFSGYSIHDSNEFLLFIIDSIHEDLNRVKDKYYVKAVEGKGRTDKQIALQSWQAYIKRNQSIIVDLIINQQKFKFICFDCGKQELAFEPFITMTLPIPQLKNHSEEPNKQLSQKNTVTLKECLELFEKTQNLHPGNQHYCTTCKKYRLGSLKKSFYKSSQILIIHLNRFESKVQKNQSYILFPLTFDFTPYLIDKLPICFYNQDPIINSHNISKNGDLEQCNKTAQYDLYAVCNHLGKYKGHYTAFAKNINGKWYEFDDSFVKSISEESVCSSAAYILFYKRKK